MYCMYVCMYVSDRIFIADSLVVRRGGSSLLVLVLQKGLVIIRYFDEHHLHSSSTHLFSFQFCFFAVKMKENEILLVVEICVEGITTMMVMMMMMMMVVVVVRYRED